MPASTSMLYFCTAALIKSFNAKSVISLNEFSWYTFLFNSSNIMLFLSCWGIKIFITAISTPVGRSAIKNSFSIYSISAFKAWSLDNRSFLSFVYGFLIVSAFKIQIIWKLSFCKVKACNRCFAPSLNGGFIIMRS